MTIFSITSLIAAGFPSVEPESTFLGDEFYSEQNASGFIQTILSRQLPFTLAGHRSHSSHSSHGSHRSSSGGRTYIPPVNRNSNSVPPASILPSTPAIPGLNGNSAAFVELVRRVQLALYVLGYYTGAIDGIAGRGTKTAIAKFQDDNGLPITGKIDDALIEALNVPLN